MATTLFNGNFSVEKRFLFRLYIHIYEESFPGKAVRIIYTG